MTKAKLKRLEAGLSIKKASELSGVTRETIRRIENGSYKYINDLTLFKLAKVYGCEFEDLKEE